MKNDVIKKEVSEEISINDKLACINGKKISEEQLRAAYALNLCTVSISQIIEYRDLNIMEQEYENILNNLNLENIAKDESLLNLLKQILDVITFFRISDGDKKIIDKHYQQKIKNAIWSSIPSPSIMVGSGPVGIGLSIASMIGTGYMNYRKAKAEAKSEYEDNIWELQRSAIEQLNGLRRELFNASWKFAERYDYPDSLRLSEKQIKQYNDIILDNNLIRQYFRLEAIKKQFYAYPPFWYYIGHVANQIFRMSDPKLYKGDKIDDKYSILEITELEMSLNEEDRIKYRDKAMAYLKMFWDINSKPLLRVDTFSSTCALELADLMFETCNSEKDRQEIITYIDKAVEYSGNESDILQLCCISYIKLNEKEKAIEYLKILVNEDYNRETNSQILSGLLISTNNSSDYNMLKARVGIYGQKYLIPWDKKENFVNEQKELVLEKINKAVEEYRKIIRHNLENIIPSPIKEDETITEETYEKKIQVFFDNKAKLRVYRNEIDSLEYILEYRELVNKYANRLLNISLLKNQEDLKKCLRESIKKYLNIFIEVQGDINSSKYSYDTFKKVEILNDVRKNDAILMFDEFYKKTLDKFKEIIEKTTSFIKLVEIDNEINAFCDKEIGIDIVLLLNNSVSKGSVDKSNEKNANRDIIDDSIFGEDIKNKIYLRTKAEAMLRFLKESNISSNLDSKRRLFIKGEREFDKQIKEKSIDYSVLSSGFAMIEDKGNNQILLFDAEGISIVDKSSGKTDNQYTYDEFLDNVYDKIFSKSLENTEVMKLKDIINEFAIWEDKY